MADASSLSASAAALWGKVQGFFSDNGYSTVLTSAGRSAAYNSTIAGASSTSQHIGGNAFDFQVFDTSGSQVDPKAIQGTLAQNGFSYGQSIAEYGAGMGPRNHLSVPTASLQGQTLVGNNGVYTPNAPSPTNLASSIATKALAGVRDFEASSLKAMGLSDSAAQTLVNPDTGIVGATAAVLGGSTLLQRGAFAIVGLLLLGAAIFAISKGTIPNPLKG